MAVAEVVTYTCTRTNVTGDFTNTASVTGTDPISGTVNDSDAADVTMIVPGITIEKTTSTPQVVGGDATFTIVVTNSGTHDWIRLSSPMRKRLIVPETSVPWSPVLS